MKFIENKISTSSNNQSWIDYVQKITGPKTIKTASVKVAEEEKKESKESKDQGPSSGQLDVEPLHQTGESVKPSAVTEKNKKTEAESVSQVKEAEKSEKKDEQVTCDCGKTEAKLTNDPKVEDKKEATSVATVKVAEDKEEDKKDEDKKDSKDEDKKDNDGGLTDAQKKLPEALQNAIKNKKALSEVKFIRLANLKAEEKSKVAKFYNKYWPKGFIDALLSDK